MPATGLGDIALVDANAVASGRGNLTDQLALIKADLDALTALANDLKAKFDAHTHNADGAQAGAYYTSPPRTNTATVTAGTTGVTSVAAVTVTAK